MSADRSSLIRIKQLTPGSVPNAFPCGRPSYPFGTLIVNVAGSLTLGLLAGLFLSKAETDQSMRLFLTTGVLGGFTTFSAFSLDAALMWQRSDWSMLAVYVFGSVILSIAAIFVGLAVAKVVV